MNQFPRMELSGERTVTTMYSIQKIYYVDGDGSYYVACNSYDAPDVDMVLNYYLSQIQPKAQ